MRKLTYFVMALALMLGFTQCKKDLLEPQSQGEQVRITLNVESGASTSSAIDGSKANVDPPHVTFETGDQILVASNGHYVGTLTYNGSNFSGDITDPVEGEPLYFYFLGNNAVLGEANGDGNITNCTVNISDQTNYPHLPVISMGVSIDRANGNATVNYDSGISTYEAQLHNKASLMKFNVTTDSDAAICITGMNNEVTVDFGDPTDSGFTHDMNTTDGGLIKMAGGAGSPAVKWAIVLPQAALTETDEAYSEDQSYLGTRPEIALIEANKYYDGGIAMTVNTHVWNGNLAILTGSEPDGFATATDGMTIYGTLNANVKVSIADGATVTLDGANININNNSKSGSSDYAGITCLGNATLNLYGGSIINCAFAGYPGIQAGPSEKTLTIQGTGSLNAQGGSNAAGIGGGNGITCGNISLLSGAISACGGEGGAGIGSGKGGSCGSIEIEGGEITATGGDGAAGIGCGSGTNAVTVCGNIYLYGGSINACGGEGAAGIGSGEGGTCGSIEIEGGEITATGGDGAAGIGSGQYGGSCGNIVIQGGGITATGGEGANNIGEGIDSGNCGTVTLHPISGLFSVSETKQVRFSRGNLQYIGSADTPYWKFADNQRDYIGNSQGSSSTDIDRDLFGWGTSGYNGMNPYMTDGGFNSYCSGMDNIANTNYDWGVYNTISNATGQWRTLTIDEWDYLLENNTNGSSVVDGVTGLVIRPNGVNTEVSSSYTLEQWATEEANGAVFLPAAGRRQRTNVEYAGRTLYYWSSSGISGNSRVAYCFTDSDDYIPNRYCGLSVRLVQDAN